LQRLHRTVGNRTIQRAFDPAAWERGQAMIGQLPNSSAELVPINENPIAGSARYHNAHLVLLSDYFQEYKAAANGDKMNPGARTQKLAAIEERIWSLLNYAAPNEHAHINSLLDLLDIVQAEQIDAFAELATLAENALRFGPLRDRDVDELVDLGWMPYAGPDAKGAEERRAAAWLWLSLFHPKSNIGISEPTAPLEPGQPGVAVAGFKSETLAMLGRLLASAGGRDLISDLQNAANPVTIAPQAETDIAWAKQQLGIATKEYNDAFSQSVIKKEVLPDLFKRNMKQAESTLSAASNPGFSEGGRPGLQSINLKNNQPIIKYGASLKTVDGNPLLSERVSPDVLSLDGQPPDGWGRPFVPSGTPAIVRLRPGLRASQLQFQGTESPTGMLGLFAQNYIVLAHELSHAVNLVRGQNAVDMPMDNNERRDWENPEERQAVERENLIRRGLGQRRRWPYNASEAVQQWHDAVKKLREKKDEW
jgi:hypothetical protein